MINKEESLETIVNQRSQEIDTAHELTVNERLEFYDNMTILEYLTKVGEDTITAFGLHKRAMALTKHGIEIVKVQFDEDRVIKKIVKMKRDSKLSREQIVCGNAEEALEWIYDTIFAAINQISGSLEFSRRGNKGFKLYVAESVLGSLLGSLGQEFAEFALTRALCPVITDLKPLKWPSWHKLGISVQDFVRGYVDMIGEVEDAYGVYMMSELGSALSLEESAARAQMLAIVVAKAHEFIDDNFSSFDDNVMRNTPNATVGIDREDREAIRKMNTPLRLRLKGISATASRLRDMFLGKRDLSRTRTELASALGSDTVSQRTA